MKISIYTREVRSGSSCSNYKPAQRGRPGSGPPLWAAKCASRALLAARSAIDNNNNNSKHQDNIKGPRAKNYICLMVGRARKRRAVYAMFWA